MRMDTMSSSRVWQGWRVFRYSAEFSVVPCYEVGLVLRHVSMAPGEINGQLIGETVDYTVVWICTGRHITLKWRHNEGDGVSNHQPHDCLLDCLFSRRSKKTSKLRVTGHCAGNSPVTGEFPAQRASNTENVSIWWRHHDIPRNMRRICNFVVVRYWMICPCPLGLPHCPWGIHSISVELLWRMYERKSH